MYIGVVMPVTAKLSRLFYERLGEEVANELVNWFNTVDASYRADLRELNELNFARFDAKLEQRMAESEAKLEQRMAASEARLEQRMAASDARFEQRVAALHARIDRLRHALEARIDGVRHELNAKIDGLSRDVHVTIERGLKEQTRFLFLAWAALLIPIIGLWFRG
jgi:DNA anti-recombination protein RmuC